MTPARRVFHALLAAVALTSSGLIELGHFGVQGWAFAVVTVLGFGYGAALVRVGAAGCLVPTVLFLGSFVVLGVLVDQASDWGPLQYGWLPAVLAGAFLARVLFPNVGARRRKETAGRGLRTAGGEWLREAGPIMLCIGAFCVAAMGALLHGEGDQALRYDDALRRTGVVVTGEVVHVERVHFTGYKGRGHTEYTPVTRQRFDGVEYETTLDEYTVSSDPDFYRVGQRLPIMVDPDDPTTAGVRSTELHRMFARNVDDGRSYAFTALPLLAVGAPLLAVQTVVGVTQRIRTRHTRRWAKARRQVRSARRRARRLAGGVESAHRAGPIPPSTIQRSTNATSAIPPSVARAHRESGTPAE
ncbi:DUF3592 domain-containing protein [Curtobacterium caseinilyticum]|uniref:DUF3592 domain-containing protein n=1 Tax=Curtobacterium caseinilyticum TaxID=3055137 RepID=A0ABT7TQJ9_9MICO|nr:DUF3592 domain-containing protein [Curtobacterium caseinilyticum]MDM7891879.1 DUF3592 domain-containing protein [Curtobacterium caseinilyticum]